MSAVKCLDSLFISLLNVNDLISYVLSFGFDLLIYWTLDSHELINSDESSLSLRR